jgi:hypothetical protein
MLTDGGYFRLAVDRVKGMTNSQPAIAIEFRFDREYVLEYIRSRIILPLFLGDKEQFMELMNESWEYHQKCDRK